MLDTALSLNRNADIFFTGLQRRWDDSKLNQQLTSFNHYLELKAEKKPRLTYVKNDSYLQDKHYKKDGLHLNDIGTSQLVCNMRSCFSQGQCPSSKINLLKTSDLSPLRL